MLWQKYFCKQSCLLNTKSKSPPPPPTSPYHFLTAIVGTNSPSQDLLILFQFYSSSLVWVHVSMYSHTHISYFDRRRACCYEIGFSPAEAFCVSESFRFPIRTHLHFQMTVVVRVIFKCHICTSGIDDEARYQIVCFGVRIKDCPIVDCIMKQKYIYSTFPSIVSNIN